MQVLEGNVTHMEDAVSVPLGVALIFLSTIFILVG